MVIPSEGSCWWTSRCYVDGQCCRSIPSNSFLPELLFLLILVLMGLVVALANELEEYFLAMVLGLALHVSWVILVDEFAGFVLVVPLELELRMLAVLLSIELVFILCDRGGVCDGRNKSTGTDASSTPTTKCTCPVSIYSSLKNQDRWTFVVRDGTHIHEPPYILSGHPAHHSQTSFAAEEVAQLTAVGLQPRHIGA
ncbi:hypothetical protein PybrP1_004859 [[Pythium] brassicae (nom. inval.)]|nr:hypothetical protein PybrP1_004859 [[Pythium] brassicae (nom. inval.)]